MRASTLLFILTFLIGLQSLSAQDSWVRFTGGEAHEFHVIAPMEMQEKSNTVKTELGELTTTAYIVEPAEDDKNLLYMVNEVTYPKGSFPKDSISLKDEYVYEAINSTAESLDGELIYSQSQKVAGENGYLFRIKYNEGKNIVKGKATIFGDTFYMLKVYSHKNDSLNDEMNSFLNSFSLVKF